MSTYSETLRRYLSQASPSYGDQDLHSILELLWRTYTDLNPIDNDMIRSEFQKLEHYFQSLPADEANFLFCFICKISIEHERLAFLEGMRVGALLTDELKAYEKQTTVPPCAEGSAVCKSSSLSYGSK